MTDLVPGFSNKTRSRRALLSLFFIAHLAAACISGIPSAEQLYLASGEAETANQGRPPATTVSRGAVPGAVAALSTAGRQLTDPIRPLAMRYARLTGIVQNWSMFGNPPTGSEYLRFRYYSTGPGPSGASSSFVATELVFPQSPDTEIPEFKAYWRAHRDKAISNALISYFLERVRRKQAGLPPPIPGDPAFEDPLKQGLVPVVHYFSETYAKRLDPARRLIRTEAWYGLAQSRAPDEVAISPRSRAAVLERYYRGLREEPASDPRFRSIDTLEDEADILWMLIYAQTPS